jgi:hypothetical protein
MLKKTATKERNKTKAAEKKDKAAAERATNKEDKKEATTERKEDADECKWYSDLSLEESRTPKAPRNN